MILLLLILFILMFLLTLYTEDKGFYKLENTFRNIASGILLCSILVMFFTGGEFLLYTINKEYQETYQSAQSKSEERIKFYVDEHFKTDPNCSMNKNYLDAIHKDYSLLSAVMCPELKKDSIILEEISTYTHAADNLTDSKNDIVKHSKWKFWLYFGE